MVQLSQRKRRPGMRSCQGVRIDLHRHFARASSRSERSQLCELSRPTKATLDSLRKNLAWWAVTRSSPKPSKLGNGSLRGYRRLPWTIRIYINSVLDCFNLGFTLGRSIKHICNLISLPHVTAKQASKNICSAKS